MSSRDDLPRALPSMWRALKRGYEAEPRLLVVAFGFSLLAALPDALLALWLKLLADGVLAHDRGLALIAAIGLGASATATWFLRVVSDRIQRRFRDRVTIALESHVAASPGLGRHDRAPRASRLPEPARGASQPGVRARSHVYVALLHVRVDPAARRDRGVTHDGPPGARVAGRLRPADGARFRVAAGRGARGRRARSTREPAGASSVRHGHHGPARQGGACGRYR